MDRIREQLMFNLGGSCRSCGSNDIRVLDISHKFQDGKFDREAVGSGYKFYLENDDDAQRDLQLLCKNCHWLYDHHELELEIW